jgi:anti-sigma regulatory factor (Ser/Thr protein kinase)
MNGSMQTIPRILRFPSRPENLERAAADVRATLDQAGVRGRARGRAELVFEEVVSNVVRHGSAGHIDVSVASDDDSLVLSFEDDGPPFDPLQHSDPVLPKAVEEANVGGLGLFLVRKVATALRYERTRDAKNRLIVTIADRR